MMQQTHLLDAQRSRRWKRGPTSSATAAAGHPRLRIILHASRSSSITMQSQPRSQVVAAASSPHARTSPRPPPPAAGSSNGRLLCRHLVVSRREDRADQGGVGAPSRASDGAALNAANEQMGIDPLGALPQQADRLLSIMGLRGQPCTGRARGPPGPDARRGHEGYGAQARASPSFPVFHPLSSISYVVINPPSCSATLLEST